MKFGLPLTSFLPSWTRREHCLVLLALALFSSLAGLWYWQTRQLSTATQPLAETRQPPQATSQAQLQQAAARDYLTGFPPERSFKIVLADMARLADNYSLVANQSNYHLSRHHPIAELGQYDMVNPIRGQYAQVKQYLQTLLNTHPTLALRDISMQRLQVENKTLVEVSLRWTYYFRVNE